MAKLKNRNRWWEFYFIRYAMGSIVGAFIVETIAAKAPVGSGIAWIKWPTIQQPHHLLLSVGVYYSLIYLVIGLAFCYIASAPILVIYANRHLGPELSRCRKAGLILVGALTAMSIVSALIGISRVDFKVANTVSILSLPAMIFVIMIVGAIWLYRDSKKGIVFGYYKRLAEHRSDKKIRWRKELIETYRHLREHGNSFAILVCEGAFGAGLYALSRIGTYAPAAMLAYIAIWSMPAVAVWVFALNLEWDFVNDK